VKSFFLTNFSVLSAPKLFLMLEHVKPYIERIHSINAEPAGHAHNFDVTLQRLCGRTFLCLLGAGLPSLSSRSCVGGLFSVCWAQACQALPLWSELTNNTLRK